MTGRDAVTAALRKIGAVAPGESPAASEASEGLSELNRMLGSWSNDGLLIHAITSEAALTLTPGDATYTLGTSGDITTRPQKILYAIIRDGSVDHTVDVVSLDEFARISQKSTQSPYPRALYDDGGYPRRTITLYPVPSTANSLVLYTRRALTSISTLDTDVSLPPGYDDAIVSNLALRLAPEYGRQVTDVMAMNASESLASIKRANQRPGYLSCDSAVVGSGSFNFESGGFER